MNTHSIEEVNSTRRKFKITIGKPAIADAFKKALSEIQTGAEIRGFRKGKAPEALIKKFYAGEVAKKAYERVVEASYQETIKDVDFQIVSYPMIEPNGQFQEGDEFTFSATVDINPKVEIVGYKELALTQTEPDPDVDEQVSKTLAQLARDNGTYEKEATGRAAQKDDYVSFDYSMTLDGKELESRSRKDARIQLDGTNIADIESNLTGLAPGATKTFSVTFPADYREEELKGKTVEFTATLKSVDILNAPVLDDEFAKRFGAQTVDDFKRNIRNSLAGMLERNKIAQFRDQIIDQILSKNAFEVPESLVEGTIDRAVAEANGRVEKKAQQDPNNEEVRNQYREWALKEVRGVLALGHIARAEGLTVDDKEVSSEMATFAAQTGARVQDLIRQYGAPIIEEFRGKVLIDKVLKHLIGLNKVEVAKS